MPNVHPETELSTTRRHSTQRRRLPSLATAGLALVVTLGWTGFVMSGVVSSAYDSASRQALSYDSLAAEMAAGLGLHSDSSLRQSIVPVQDSAVIARMQKALTVYFDSLAIVDTSFSPALRLGGFLNDEVQKYNRYRRGQLHEIRDRMARGEFAERSLMDLRAAANPSIFRTNVTFVSDTLGDHEQVVLSPRAVTSALRVPSPFEIRREVIVGTRSAPDQISLTGPDGSTQLEGKGRLPGGDGCGFQPRGDSVNIQCQMPGSQRREVLLHFPRGSRTDGSLSIVGQRPVLYDGVRVAGGRPFPVRAGGLVQLPSRFEDGRPQSLAIERTIGGALAGTQWVNGQFAWRTNPQWSTPFARQLAAGSGFGGMTSLRTRRLISLSLDAPLARDIQAQLASFVGGQRQAKDLAFAVVTVANARTGEILSVAEIGSQEPDEPSFVMRALNVGSAIKPVLTAAALSVFPDLATLEILSPGGEVRELWGYRLNSGFHSGEACPSGWIDMRLFLQCSSNLYSASLVAAALQSALGKQRMDRAGGIPFRLRGQLQLNARPHLPLDRDLAIHPESLFASGLTAGLDSLFGLTTGIEDAIIGGGRDPSPWQGLRYSDGEPLTAPFGVWPEQSRVGFIRQGRRGTLRQLSAVAIGAGETRLTPIQLAQAFARILTDRKVTLTFVPASATAAQAPSLSLAQSPWYDTVRDGLLGVGTAGTARGTDAAVRSTLGDSIAFFGKTGTLNTRPVRVRRIAVDTLMVDDSLSVRIATTQDTIPAVVVKSLVFGVGKPGAASAPALSCGVVGTIYFRLRANPLAVDKLAVNFANGHLWHTLAAHWDRLNVC